MSAAWTDLHLLHQLQRTLGACMLGGRGGQRRGQRVLNPPAEAVNSARHLVVARQKRCLSREGSGNMRQRQCLTRSSPAAGYPTPMQQRSRAMQPSGPPSTGTSSSRSIAPAATSSASRSASKLPHLEAQALPRQCHRCGPRPAPARAGNTTAPPAHCAQARSWQCAASSQHRRPARPALPPPPPPPHPAFGPPLISQCHVQRHQRHEQGSSRAAAALRWLAAPALPRQRRASGRGGCELAWSEEDSRQRLDLQLALLLQLRRQHVRSGSVLCRHRARAWPASAAQQLGGSGTGQGRWLTTTRRATDDRLVHGGRRKLSARR